MDCSPPGSSMHGIFQVRILEWVAIHSLLQEIFLTQGLNLGLLHCRKILYCLNHQGSPKEVKVAQSCPTICDRIDYTVCGILQARILEWVAFPFSRGSSQPRDRTQVSCIAGGFFTSRITREAQEYWSGWPIPSPAALPDPGIKPGSPALQADSLLAELSGKP